MLRYYRSKSQGMQGFSEDDMWPGKVTDSGLPL